MTFLAPHFIQVGIAVALLVAIGIRSQAGRRRRLADALGGPPAAARLARGDLYRLRGERILLLGGAALALGFAAAEPRWGGDPPEAPPPPPIRSTVIAIDVSMSMQADDVEPTRLARAVELASELLDALENDRVGLLLFAGRPYPIAPPTHDHAAIAYFLAGVTPTIASAHDPGTLVSGAVRAGMELLERGADPEGARTLVIIGDGESGEAEAEVLAALQEATDNGVRIHAIGVGTPEGGGMVVPAAPFQLERRVVDPGGAPAVSRLDAALLGRMGSVGGGRYAHAEDDAAVRELIAWFDAPVPEPLPDPRAAPWTRMDPTVWLTVLALALLLVEGLLDVRVPGLRRLPDRRVA